MVDVLRLIDVNAGGLRLKKGQGVLHLSYMFARDVVVLTSVLCSFALLVAAVAS